MISIEKYKKITNWLNVALGVSGLTAVIIIFRIIGFYISDAETEYLILIIDFIILFFVSQEIVRFAICNDRRHLLKERILEAITSIILLLYLTMPGIVYGLMQWFFPFIRVKDLSIIYTAVGLVPILFLIIRKVLKYNYLIGRLQLHPGAIFMISFALIIIAGTFILMLPKSAPVGKSVSFIDALFTSTSAVCVTGLTVLDTAKDFSTLGQIFILVLIQIGGLGVMTLTTLFAMFVSGGMSFQVRVMMGDILSENNLSDVSKLIIRIIAITAVIEFIGLVLMYISLGGSLISPNFDFAYTSLFHSISAFCNAGFSIYSEGLMHSLTATNHYFLSVIMILIVIGGIGFAVISDIFALRPFNKKKLKIRYQLRAATKVILITTACLIIIPGVIIFALEPVKFPEHYNWCEKLFHSFFLSITSRTAGFNSIPTGMLSNPVTLLVMILMIIGASPGSTGGGIKTSTFALSIIALVNLIRGKKRMEMFQREINPEMIKKSFMIIFSYMLVLFIGSLVFSIIEPDKDPLSLMFEAISALSTVGLSKDITFHIGDGSKGLLTLLMFMGRVGVLTFFLALYKPSREPNYSLPKTDILLG